VRWEDKVGKQQQGEEKGERMRNTQPETKLLVMTPTYREYDPSSILQGVYSLYTDREESHRCL
jgi:hypothetical protein